MRDRFGRITPFSEMQKIDSMKCIPSVFNLSYLAHLIKSRDFSEEENAFTVRV